MLIRRSTSTKSIVNRLHQVDERLFVKYNIELFFTTVRLNSIRPNQVNICVRFRVILFVFISVIEESVSLFCFSIGINYRKCMPAIMLSILSNDFKLRFSKTKKTRKVVLDRFFIKFLRII